MALAAIADSDAVVVPTFFLRDSFPAHFCDHFPVIHEGVNLDFVMPIVYWHMQLKPPLILAKGVPIVTYVSRNFEPLSGLGFMRSLPELLASHQIDFKRVYCLG